MTENREELIASARNILSSSAHPISFGALSKKLGVSVEWLRDFRREIGFQPIGKQIVKSIKRIQKSGKRLYNIRQEIGLTAVTLHRYAKDMRVSMHEPVLGDEDVNKLRVSLNGADELTKRVVDLVLEGGRTEAEIGRVIGRTRECVRQCIDGLGLHNTFEDINLRYERKLIEARTKIVTFLNERVECMLSELSLPERRAHRYFMHSHLRDSDRAIPYEKLLKLFQVDETARISGEKIGLDELAKRAGFEYRNNHVLSPILRSAGLIPPRVKRIFFKLSEERKDAIRKTAELGYLSGESIRRFAGLGRSNFINKVRKGSRRECIKSFGCQGVLNHYKASEIYEARDEGFSRKEISELCSVNERIFDYALNVEGEVSPQIVTALRILFPKTNITKPYYTPKIEEVYK